MSMRLCGHLSCRRPAFLKEMDGHIRIVIKGCGHGYGLSQYGAEDMAKNKKSYEEILKYYFSGIKIEKMGNTNIIKCR